MDNPGLTPEVQQAIQRRMGGAPQLSQVSPQAPMQNTVPQPMNPSDMTSTSNPPAQTGQTPQKKFEPQDKMDMIVMSLLEYLKNDQKFQKEKLQFQIPQM